METLLRYRGRDITQADIEAIRLLIESNPRASRRGLSLLLCAQWNWMQENGAPKDAVCRGLMLALARVGHIELPAARWRGIRPPLRRRSVAVGEVDQSELCVPFSELQPLELRQVRRTADEALFDHLIQTHHYLGYTRPVGEHLKYMAFWQGRPVACFAWSSAPRHLGPRDRYIGWPAPTRRQNIRFVAYNSRYLIPPWVRVKHLASHLLGRMTRMLPSEWNRVYGHPVHFAETFVDTERYRGTCYRAANWVFMGRTTGRGKDDLTNRPNRSLKDVLGLALTRDFREQLGGRA
jgi:hypothetical protein